MKDFFQRAKTLHPIRDLDNSKVGPENEHLIGSCSKTASFLIGIQ